jgi:hypothetical protein
MIKDPIQKGYQNRELVYKTDIASDSAVSSLTISGLNGSKDKHYVLELELNLSTHASTHGLEIKPHNVTFTPITTTINNSATTSDFVDTALYVVNLASGKSAAAKSFNLEFKSSDGINWMASGSFVRGISDGSTEAARIYCNQSTTTNLTSFVFSANAGTFYGSIRLYKIIGD